MKYQFRKRRWRWLATCLDAFGVLFKLGLDQRSGGIPKDPRKILVVRLDHIGDVVRASAIPQLLKETYPTARTIFLTNAAGAQLLEGNPYIDEVIVYDPRWYQIGSHTGPASSAGFFAIVKRLKSMHLDTAILPRGDLRENLLVRLAKVPHRIGYGITGGGFLLTREVPFRQGVHEDQHTLDILRTLGVEANSLRPRIYLSGRESKFSEAVKPDVMIQLEAGTPAKQWDPEMKLSFMNACTASFSNVSLVFVGQDKGTSAALDAILAEGRHPKWHNLIGKTSLHDLKHLISRTRLFVGFDSGPTHMAAVLGVRTLFVYSGTNEVDAWRPLSEQATVYQNKVDCSPCHLAKCTVPGHPCMTGVAPEKIIHWIKEKL